MLATTGVNISPLSVTLRLKQSTKNEKCVCPQPCTVTKDRDVVPLYLAGILPVHGSMQLRQFLITKDFYFLRIRFLNSIIHTSPTNACCHELIVLRENNLV